MQPAHQPASTRNLFNATSNTGFMQPHTSPGAACPLGGAPTCRFGRECWVTKGFKRALTYGPSTHCNYTCPGDRNQTCGGW